MIPNHTPFPVLSGPPPTIMTYTYTKSRDEKEKQKIKTSPIFVAHIFTGTWSVLGLLVL